MKHSPSFLTYYLKGEFNSSLLDREELITEHAIAWNKRKINGMAQSLSRRYTRVSIILCCTVINGY